VRLIISEFNGVERINVKPLTFPDILTGTAFQNFSGERFPTVFLNIGTEFFIGVPLMRIMVVLHPAIKVESASDVEFSCYGIRQFVDTADFFHSVTS
jgi:hypothetical protein